MKFNTFADLAEARLVTGTPVTILEPYQIDGIVRATGEGLTLLSGNVFVPFFGDQEVITARKTSLIDDAFPTNYSAYINRYTKDNSGAWVEAADGRTSAVYYGGQAWWPLVEVPYKAGGYLVTDFSLPTGNPDILELELDGSLVFQFNRFKGLVDGGTGGGSIVSETPPDNPLAGIRWTRCSDMKSFIWYVDDTSAQWVEDNPSVGAPLRADDIALGGGAVFASTEDFATGTSLYGVLGDDVLLSLVGESIRCRTEGFYEGSTEGNAPYIFLNESDSSAAGYVDGVNRFQIRGLDVYACEISAYDAALINTSDGRNVQERLDDLPDEVDAAGTAQTLINGHNHDVSAHPELSSFITSEADRAEAAADAAQLSAGVYSDTTAGLTATSEGDYFSVPSVDDDEYLILYLHDTGSVATEIKRYPSVNKVDGIEGDIRELGYFAELEANYVEVTTDEDGNVMEAITPDGMRLVNGLRVGNVEVGLDEKSGILELINTSGVSIDSTVYIDKAIDLIGQFSGYSFILCDEDGNISQGVAHNGSTLTSIGTSVGWDLKYSSATSLPDNSRQPNPSGGFTCTGITRINTGFWAVSNHGIASEGGSVQEPSIVFLHLDFTKIRKEINFDNWSNPVTGSIQGITFNPNDNTIWFIDKTNGLVRQTDYDATDYDNDIDPGYTVNGLAYNTAENGLWIPREGTTVCNLYSVDTKTIIRSINVRTNLDQMFHDPVTDLIYYTYGSNGTNGNIEVIDTNGNVLHNFTGIKFAQSIEGIYVDDNKLYITNDGGYHTSAKPPLSMVLEYDLTLGDY